MLKNRTLRYLSGKKAKRGYDGQKLLPPNLFSDPTFVKRLSYKASDSDLESRKHLSKTIRQAPPEVAFFLDTNMWDLKFEPELWHALLARSDSVFVIMNVRLELQDWIVAHPDFQGSRALMDKKSNLIIKNIPPIDSNECTAYAYYVFLLQTRRLAGEFLKENIQNQEGRDLSPIELISSIQHKLGERGLALIHKHGKTTSPDHRATDESLVYFAATHAITTGRPTVVLTKDQDVLEQFYKLWWFLDTHYRAMLMADEYNCDPFRYRHYPVPDLPVIRECFDVDDGLLLARGANRMIDVLPKKFDFVSSECWLVGNTLTRLAFGSERQMSCLLKVKGATGGLVSSQLRGRNLHPWLAPLPLDMRMRNCAAIVKDRTIQVPGTRAYVGQFDILHSINTFERFSHIVPETDESAPRIIRPWPQTS